ncbi:MAG: FeoB-associated Cys-rich membrane protein [Tissierellia bacterium]|nr:FeoB-associated Cys-rich membrane protein [Tissierellia bacterium]
MTLINSAILGVFVILIVLAIRSLVKNKDKGCGGGCANCSVGSCENSINNDRK